MMTNHRGVRWGVAGLAMAVAAVPALAAPESGQILQEAVERRLAGEETIAASVSVDVTGPDVTLRGTVKSLWEKEWAIERTRGTDGVGSVMSELTVMAADSDEELARAVSRAIDRYPYYTVFDWAEIDVTNGVVRLQGEVTARPDKPGDLRERVARVSGVQEVVNEIEVLSPGIGDERIRAALARTLFRQHSFSRYLGVPPDVRITVRNGYVTLRGVVHDEGDRILAESLARRTFGVIKVVNELTIR